MKNANGERPSYYAVIPASVRYDENLPPGAKLLYGEISSLCNKKGFCFAGNAYFAELYNTSERTVISWINRLKKRGHISVSFIYAPGKKEVQSRFIRLSDPSFCTEKPKPDEKNAAGSAPCAGSEARIQESEEKNAPEAPSGGGSEAPNPEVVKISSPRGEKNFTTYGRNFPEVVKIFSKGGEKNFTDNTKFNIKTTTTASSSDPPKQNENPAPENGKAAGEFFTPEELKKELLSADGRLHLKENFFSDAPAFMAGKGLGLGYLPWLANKCENMKYSSFAGLYFSLFFQDNFVEEYKASAAAAPEKPPPAFPCPSCGAVNGRDADECASCGLPRPYSAPEDQILYYRKLHEFSPEKRSEYFLKEDEIHSVCGNDFEKLNFMLAELKHDFGVTEVP